MKIYVHDQFPVKPFFDIEIFSGVASPAKLAAGK
jgi:hypothetical protein